MKNIYCVFLIIISSFPTLAQPTITAANFTPVAGDNYIIHTYTPTILSPGPIGANQTWNLSGAGGFGVTSCSYLTPSATPNGNSFPSATIAAYQSNYYDYLVTSSNNISRVGLAQNGLIINYSDPEKLMRFPISFGIGMSDSLAATFVSGGLITRVGDINLYADGYGTLILPWGTINDVLRLHFQENFTDDNGTTMTQAFNDGYLWVKPGIHTWVATMIESNYGGVVNLEGTYIDATSVGIDEAEINGIGLIVYPNPASEYVNLSFVLSEKSLVEYVVTDVRGNEVYRGSEDVNASATSKSIDVSEFAEGLYFINVNMNGRMVARKVMVY